MDDDVADDDADDKRLAGFTLGGSRFLFFYSFSFSCAPKNAKYNGKRTQSVTNHKK